MVVSRSLTKEGIAEQYLDLVTAKELAPVWVYQFTDQMELDEEDFHTHFEDITHLERYIWYQIFHKTLDILNNDDTYSGYSCQEKLLSFYFTLIEVMEERRDALRSILKKVHLPSVLPRFLADFKKEFLTFADNIVQEGINHNELATRPFLDSFYKEGLWAQCYFVLHFWRKDRSQNLTATDAAIEKAVDLSFELMGPSAIDSMVGFGKFLFQHWNLRN